MGDEKAKVVLDEYNKMVRSALDKFDGTEIKQLGDGFLFSFSNAQQSLKASMAIMDSIEGINLSQDTGLSVRIGLHAGEIIRDRNDVIGSAVNMAERIMREASEGEIVTSETFRELMGIASGLNFIDIGEKELKGFPEQKKIYRVEAQQGFNLEI